MAVLTHHMVIGHGTNRRKNRSIFFTLSIVCNEVLIFWVSNLNRLRNFSLIRLEMINIIRWSDEWRLYQLHVTRMRYDKGDLSKSLEELGSRLEIRPVDGRPVSKQSLPSDSRQGIITCYWCFAIGYRVNVTFIQWVRLLVHEQCQRRKTFFFNIFCTGR